MMEEYKIDFFQVLFFAHGFLTYYFEPKYKTLGTYSKQSSLVKLVSSF